MSLKVGVIGAFGRMGRAAVQALAGAEDVELSCLIDRDPGELFGQPVTLDLRVALEEAKPSVMVEFTLPEHAVRNALTCLERGISPVIGTSGMGSAEIDTLTEACAKFETPAMVVPNFAIGAVLMMRFAELAARWMPEAAIVELHHAGKADAPSGTAMHTAERIARGRIAEVPARNVLIKAEGALGAKVDQVPVHSIRLPGLVAHQEVLFGNVGETLTIRHDSMDRSSFMPGVLLAVRNVRMLQGLTVGLEPLMFAS